jgi:hypothetical protein
MAEKTLMQVTADYLDEVRNALNGSAIFEDTVLDLVSFLEEWLDRVDEESDEAKAALKIDEGFKKEHHEQDKFDLSDDE